MKLSSFAATTLAAGLALGAFALAPVSSRSALADDKDSKKETTEVKSLHDLKTTSLDGKEVALSEYKGKVLLIVNVASKCGFTPQYDGLQKLHAELEGKGFLVLGFPSNEFGGQEPGTPEEIKTFCSSKYNVKFPLFSKVVVKKGEGQSPVYKFLTASHDEPSWNFCKYLVGKDGKVIGFYPSKVKPDDADLRKAIDAALK